MGGGERCPLLPPPPPLFEFKCFCVRVSFISPDEHISSKWMLMFQPIDGYCFFYLFIFYQAATLCLCADAYSDHLFISWHGAPSIHQGFSSSRPHPNMAPHCLHKVQMKSLITHSPIGSCLRIIERVAAVALTFFLPPPPPPRRDARLLVRVGGRLRVHVLHHGGDMFDGTIKEG